MYIDKETTESFLPQGKKGFLRLYGKEAAFIFDDCGLFS